jgi:hypothetical protein
LASRTLKIIKNVDEFVFQIEHVKDHEIILKITEKDKSQLEDMSQDDRSENMVVPLCPSPTFIQAFKKK